MRQNEQLSQQLRQYEESMRKLQGLHDFIYSPTDSIASTSDDLEGVDDLRDETRASVN